MRILFLSAALPMAWGSEGRAFRFLKYLSRGRDLDLVSFHAWPGCNPPREVQPALIADLEARCRRVSLVPLSRPSALGNCICNAISEEPFQVAYHRSEAMRQTVREHLARERYDLIWVNRLPMAQYAEGLSAPSILDADGCASHRYHRLSRLPQHLPRRQFYYGEAARILAYEARMLPQFTRCLVSSAADREDLWQIAPDAAIQVLPNTLELGRLMPLPRAEHPRLAFLGDLHNPIYRDAAAYLCRRILPRVRRQLPAAEALIIGPGEARFLRGLALLPNVHVTGYLPGFGFQSALAEAQVVVCPLRADAGFPVPVVEAMACGKPVIASPVVVNGLGLRPGAPILAAERAAEFAHRAVSLLQQPRLAEGIGGRGRLLVLERFDLRAVADRLEDILHHLVPQPRASLKAAR
jgi:glycosyltransferase involved in cell wall biosynthesis